MKTTTLRNLILGILAFAPLTVFGGDEANAALREPVATRVVTPSVPWEFQRAGITGNVDVTFVIDANGRPRNIEVVTASHPEFADSVENALRKWQFELPEDGHEPRSRVYKLPVQFN